MRTWRGDPPWPDRPEGWRHDAIEPSQAFRVPWSITDAMVMVVWTLVAQVVVGVVVLAMGLDVFADNRAAAAVSLIAQVVIVVGVVAWLAGRRRLSWRLLGPLPPRTRDLLVGVGVGASGFVLVTVLLVVVEQLAGRVDAPQQPLREMIVEGGTTALLVVLVAVVLGPLLEEIVFRGLLFQAIRERAGAFPAMGLSALLFGAVHLPQIVQEDGSLNLVALPSIVALAILGFWFAGAFHRTGRLLVTISGHATFNGIALLLTVLGPRTL